MRVLALGAGLLATLAGCASIDFDHPKAESHALQETGDTQLGRLNASLQPQQPGESRFHLISDGIEALAARLILAQHAERSIDAQYFLIKADPAGFLFLDALLGAADRGVRVRLLLDDSDTVGYDRGLFALDAHPNVEVRIFNPFVRGFSRMLHAGLDFRRVNRRMHNKSFTADNQVTVIGGRNIGGEYFNARPDYNFGDLDVLCFGPVVQEVSSMFDLYWNDELAVPVPGVIRVGPAAAKELEATFRERIRAGWQAAQGTLFAAALEETILAPERDARKLVSAPYELVYDPPAKAHTQRDGDMQTILGPLGRTLESATSELLLVSPYFVPMRTGVELFRDLRARGITCKVVTNSLASTNQVLVHTGYYSAREPLLELGVELYEVRPDVSVTGAERSEARSSRAGLHTKAFMVDRRHLFIGSFNFDPRSAYINTEMGIVIESKELCELVARRVDEGLPTTTWRVVLNEKGYLRWIAMDEGVETVHIREPAGYWRKVYVSFMGLLPIQRQL